MSASPFSAGSPPAAALPGLIETWRLADGCRATLRPVRPTDAALVQTFVATLSPEARRHRFHAAVPGPIAALGAHLAQTDNHQPMSFVITVALDDDEIVIGDARFMVGGDDPQTAEFAIVVADDFTGQGLGVRLLAALCGAARRGGLRWICGEVLAGNAAMLGLAARCGFSVHPHANDDSRVLIERSVETHFFAARPTRFVDSLFGTFGQSLPQWMRPGRRADTTSRY